jgi:hypothetical protein
MTAKTSEKLEGLCERDRINAARFIRWFVVFALLFSIGAIVLGPEKGTPLWHLVFAFLPVIPAYFALNAYFRFMKDADELIRQIHFEAAAHSFVVVIFAGYFFHLAAQVFGGWEDSGAILCLLGFFSYVVNIRRARKRFDV